MSDQISAKIPYDSDKLSTKQTELYETAIEEYVEEHNTVEAYEEELDSIYGYVSICGFERSSGAVLKEVDPIAFRCGMSDNEDNIRERAKESIDEDDFRDDALEALNMLDEE